MYIMYYVCICNYNVCVCVIIMYVYVIIMYVYVQEALRLQTTAANTDIPEGGSDAILQVLSCTDVSIE